MQIKAVHHFLETHACYSLGDIQEYDWQKIKDIEFQEMMRTKTGYYKRVRTEFQCTKCPDLEDHVKQR